MTRRKSAIPEFHEGQLLNWRAPWHWGRVELPCRYCGGDTPLRDTKGHPAHKVCAEKALVEQYAQALRQYQEGVL
jgi:hypothetical protein